MNIMDLIVSNIIKKGIVYEARNCDMEFDIPLKGGDSKSTGEEIKIRFKAEHMTLRVEKGNES